MTIHHHPILRADTSLLCWSEILREIVLALTIALAGSHTLLAAPEGTVARGRLELATQTHASVAFQSLSQSRALFCLSDGTRLDVPTSTVVGWGRLPPWPQGPMVLLAGGGVLAGTIESLDAQTAVLQCGAFGRIELPARAVNGYRLSIAAGPVPRQVKGLDAETSNGLGQERLCQVQLLNGDRVAARQLSWTEQMLQLDGVQNLAAAVPIAARKGKPATSGSVQIPVGMVQAIDLPIVKLVQEKSTLRSVVALVDGSRFPVAAIDPIENPNARPPLAECVVLAGDIRHKAVCDPGEIVAIAVDGGCAQALATLTPTAVMQTPSLAVPWLLAMGCTPTGDWLSARGVTAFDGLGLHGPARLSYRFVAPVDRFESLVAIDDSAGHKGSVIVRILARRKEGAMQEVFASPVLRGGDEPHFVQAELQQAIEIQLCIEAADRGDILDRTVWLDPRVVVSATASD